MSDIVTLVPPHRERLIGDEPSAIARFVTLKLDAFSILTGASRIPHLPMILRAQALASANLIGTTLHRVRGSRATPDDAELMATDLRAICRIIDPLIEAIGEIAVINGMPREHMKLFKDQLFASLDGNAIYALEEEWPEQMREDRE